MVYDLVTNYIIQNPKTAVVLILGGVFLVWQMVTGGGKPYCYVRIREKRGDNLLIRPKSLKAYKRKILDESGRRLEWLHISGVKKNWRLPRSDELQTTTKGIRVLELVHLGGNKFISLKPEKCVYEKTGKGLYKRINITDYGLNIIPDDVKLIDYQVSSKIDQITSNANWFDKYIKPYATIMIVGMICVMLVYLTVDKLAKEFGATREDQKQLSDMIVGYFDEKSTTRPDDNTVVKSNPDGGGGG